MLLLIIMLGCKDTIETGNTETIQPGSWDSINWIVAGNDQTNDCTSADSECEVDIIEVALAKEQERFHIGVSFQNQLPITYTFEVFVFSTKEPLGRSYRLHDSLIRTWLSECEATKHDGCHWYEEELPSSFAYEDLGDGRFIFSIDLADVDYGNSILVGAAGAPTEIEVSAEFTDRFPDELWITSQNIQGLIQVEF